MSLLNLAFPTCSCTSRFGPPDSVRLADLRCGAGTQSTSAATEPAVCGIKRSYPGTTELTPNTPVLVTSLGVMASGRGRPRTCSRMCPALRSRLEVTSIAPLNGRRVPRSRQQPLRRRTAFAQPGSRVCMHPRRPAAEVCKWTGWVLDSFQRGSLAPLDLFSGLATGAQQHWYQCGHLSTVPGTAWQGPAYRL